MIVYDKRLETKTTRTNCRFTTGTTSIILKDTKHQCIYSTRFPCISPQSRGLRLRENLWNIGELPGHKSHYPPAMLVYVSLVTRPPLRFTSRFYWTRLPRTVAWMNSFCYHSWAWSLIFSITKQTILLGHQKTGLIHWFLPTCLSNALERVTDLCKKERRGQPLSLPTPAFCQHRSKAASGINPLHT